MVGALWSLVCLGGGCFIWEKHGKKIKSEVKKNLKLWLNS